MTTPKPRRDQSPGAGRQPPGVADSDPV